MEDIVKTLPRHSIRWLNGKTSFYKYQDFWNFRHFVEGAIMAQQTFTACPSDILLCSCPKTGTTWLKALAFAIVTRDKFTESTSPLLTTLPHNCVPYLETGLDQILTNREDPSWVPLMATHLPFTSLPESVLASNCKIVYIYRNIKDVVSHYHHVRGSVNLDTQEAPFEMAFDEFCEGVSIGGPYWAHVMGYWKSGLEWPERTLLVKYEDMKRDPVGNVKRLAEFIGCPFSDDEVEENVVDNIVKMCSFENLKNLEVNRNGKLLRSKVCHENMPEMENRIFFRKAVDGDWKNYFTDEMKEKIDRLIDEKLSGTGLVLS